MEMTTGGWIMVGIGDIGSPWTTRRLSGFGWHEIRRGLRSDRSRLVCEAQALGES